MLHYLRIAVTALGLTACVLLIALWVRSYYLLDKVHGTAFGRLLIIQSGQGGLRILAASCPVTIAWRIDSVPLANSHEPIPESQLEFDRTFTGTATNYLVMLPHAFLMLWALVAAVSPWIRWTKRFSLRTLLIATTLVAVLLGIVVAAM